MHVAISIITVACRQLAPWRYVYCLLLFARVATVVCVLHAILPLSTACILADVRASRFRRVDAFPVQVTGGVRVTPRISDLHPFYPSNSMIRHRKNHNQSGNLTTEQSRARTRRRLGRRVSTWRRLSGVRAPDTTKETRQILILWNTPVHRRI